MSRSIIFLLTVLLLILSYQQTELQAAESPIQLPCLLVDRQVLPNGLTLLVQENHNNELVAFEVIIRTGSIFEGKWQGSGMCHLIEHMLFKGTSKRPGGKIEAEVKSLGGTINAYTSHQYTGITLTVPSSNTLAALDILSDMVSDPVFDQDELKKEMDVILSEIKMNQDDPKRFLSKKFWEYFYLTPPYNLPIIGIESIFKTITRSDVVEFFQKWYIPNNMIIAVAGDVEKEQIREYINETFGKLTTKPYPEYCLPEIRPQSGMRSYEHQFDVNVMHLMIGFPSVALTDEDSAALDVIAAVLGQGESSLLQNRVVRKDRTAYSAGAFNYTPGFKGMFAISVTLDPANKQKVLDAVFDELKTLKSRALSEKQIEKAKNLYLSQYLFEQQNVQSQAKSIAMDYYYTGNTGFTEDYIYRLAKLTPQDIQRCAQKYFARDNYMTLVLTPEQKQEDPAKPPRPEDSRIEQLELDNGLRLILKENHDLPIVSIGMYAAGGVRFESETDNGLFNLLSRMLLKGTKKRNAEKIAAEAESLGASLDSFSGYNSFGLNLECLSKDIDKGLEIFSDLILNSDFPQKEIDLLRSIVLKEIETQNDDIFRDSFNRAKQGLFDAFPYRLNVLGSTRSVEKIDRSMLVEAKKRFLSPQNMVITVFGDFDKSGLTEKIKRTFSQIKKQSRDLTQPVFSEPLRQEQKIIKNKREKQQAVLIFAFPACDIFNQDRYTLELLNSLLASSGSVLYDRIREQEGLAYTLGGGLVTGVDSGFFYIYVATRPEETEQVKTIVREEIDKAKNKFFSDDAISANKNYLIGERERSQQSNGSLSFTVGLDVLYGLGTEQHQLFRENIEVITADAIQQAAVKYLVWPRSVLLITKESFND